VLSVESYSGEVGGREGVKREQKVVLTASGAELMSNEPSIDALEIFSHSRPVARRHSAFGSR
jgi:hypothetical protein